MSPPPPVPAAAARPRPAPAEAPRRRAPLRVVDPAARSTRVRRRPVPEYLAGLLLVGSLLAVVVGHTLLASGQVRLSGTEASLSAAQAVHSQLEVTVALGEAPPRIVGAAARQDQMGPPATIEQLQYVPLSVPLAPPHITPAPPPPAATPATGAATTSTGATTGATTSTGATTGATTSTGATTGTTPSSTVTSTP